MRRPKRISLTEDKLRRMLRHAYTLGESDGMRLMLDKDVRGSTECVNSLMERRAEL